MKKTLTLVALLSISTFAADYSTMTTTDLQALRGNVPTEERAAFQAEMQTRVQAMTPTEQQAFHNTMVQSNIAHTNMSNRQSSMGSQQGSMGAQMQTGQAMGGQQGSMGAQIQTRQQVSMGVGQGSMSRGH
ncbi:MAG: DUF1104 domain-containing protein [Sulfuricurvum sp.]